VACHGDFRGLPPHHRAWLEAHPHRTREWLRHRLADGFDVHHLNADPTDNSPDNLVLIEHTDHMRIHDAPSLFYRIKLTPLNECMGRKAAPDKKKPSRKKQALLDLGFQTKSQLDRHLARLRRAENL
jgi:hypothetical protein